jgi:hypothetical protein
MRKPVFRRTAIALAAAALLAGPLLAPTGIHAGAAAGALAHGQYSAAGGNQQGAGFEHQSISYP